MLLVMMLAILPPCFARASPAGLFWQLDGPSLVDGGGDVPGQIAGMPQVRRPTSLTEASHSQLRLDYTSHKPLMVRRDGAVVGGWRSSTLDTQFCFPLGDEGARSRWHLGLAYRERSDDVNYPHLAEDWNVRVSSNLTTLAAAYDLGSGWTAGVAAGTGRTRCIASGAQIRDALKLPADSSKWPTISSDSRSCALALSRRRDGIAYGFQYEWSRPRQSLSVTRETAEARGPLSASGSGWEAYVELGGGAETYFLTAAEYSHSSAGSIYDGSLGTARVQLFTDDLRIAAGWRRAEPNATRQLLLDWRNSSFDTDNAGHSGILPGLASDLYTLRGRGQVATTSVRYGMHRDLGSQWSLLTGLSLHDVRFDTSGRLLKTRNVRRDTSTVFDYSAENGRMRMAAASLGACYRSGPWRALLTYTAAYADINRALSDMLEPPPDKPDRPSSKIQPQGFWTLHFQRDF